MVIRTILVVTPHADVGLQVCAVASTPGHTKSLQTIALERGLKIVDSPGVVFDDADDLVDSAGRPRPKGNGVLLRNVVRIEDLPDPIALGSCTPSKCLKMLKFILQQSKKYSRELTTKH